MTLDSLSFGLLWLWMGFGIALQVHTQTKADAQSTAQGWTKRRMAVCVAVFSSALRSQWAHAPLVALSALISSPNFRFQRYRRNYDSLALSHSSLKEHTG